MRIDNPVTSEFLQRYPVDAARVLEQVSVEHVVDYLKQIPVESATAVIIAMMPGFAASCLGKMDTQKASILLNNVPVMRGARIFRLMNSEQQKEISAHLSVKQRMRIKRTLNYSALSAGDFMNPNVDMLPDSLTVADAVRRIESYRQSVKCEIYVVDKDHRFLGVVDLGKLLVSKSHVSLRNIMSPKLRPVSVRAGIDKILAHPGWTQRNRLPVVDTDNVLVGILDFARVKGSVESDMSLNRDSMGNLFSLAALFWLSMVQLLESLLNIATIKKQRVKQ